MARKCVGKNLGFASKCSRKGAHISLGLCFYGGFYFCDTHFDEFRQKVESSDKRSIVLVKATK